MEESGTIVIRVSKALADKLVGDDRAGCLIDLIAETGLDVESVDQQDAVVDQAAFVDPYIELAHDGPVWSGVSDDIVARGTGIECYARHHDEYGTSTFFALTPDGQRSGFQCEEECDEIEDEDYIADVLEGLNNWHDMLPQPVKDAFPDFASIKAIRKRFA